MHIIIQNTYYTCSSTVTCRGQKTERFGCMCAWMSGCMHIDYRIAGYFRGTKFSRIAQTKHFVREFYFQG